MALYQLNDTDGDSYFLLQTNANEGKVTKVWKELYYKELDGDEMEEAVCSELERQGYEATRTFLTEINP